MRSSLSESPLGIATPSCIGRLIIAASFSNWVRSGWSAAPGASRPAAGSAFACSPIMLPLPLARAIVSLVSIAASRSLLA